MKKSSMRVFQIVIVLLFLNVSSVFAQNRIEILEAKVDSLKLPFTGEVISDTMLTKDIFKLANAKLILAKEYKAQYESYRESFRLQTISNQLADSIIGKQKQSIAVAIITMNNMAATISDNELKISKLKNQRTLLAGTSIVLALLVLISL